MTVTEASSVSPLGQQLIRSGLLTHVQLSEALRKQVRSGLRLGEICLQCRWLTPEQLYSFIPSDAIHLGELLIVYQRLEFDQLELALQQQRRYGWPLGEILVERKWLDQPTLAWALSEQRYLQDHHVPQAWIVMGPRLATYLASLSLSLIDAEPSPPLDYASLVPSQEKALMARIADLEHQLQAQEEAFDVQCQDMNRQVADFHQVYQERIEQLQHQLSQAQEQLTHIETALNQANVLVEHYEEIMISQKKQIRHLQDQLAAKT